MDGSWFPPLTLPRRGHAIVHQNPANIRAAFSGQRKQMDEPHDSCPDFIDLDLAAPVVRISQYLSGQIIDPPERIGVEQPMPHSRKWIDVLLRQRNSSA